MHCVIETHRPAFLRCDITHLFQCRSPWLAVSYSLNWQMTGADSGGAAIISRYICMRCIPALVLKAHILLGISWEIACLPTRPSGFLVQTWTMGPEDLVWTILLAGWDSPFPPETMCIWSSRGTVIFSNDSMVTPRYSWSLGLANNFNEQEKVRLLSMFAMLWVIKTVAQFTGACFQLVLQGYSQEQDSHGRQQFVSCLKQIVLIVSLTAS